MPEVVVPSFTLHRLSQTEYATWGQLVDSENKFVAKTVERPWVDLDKDGIGDRNVSCIPAGTYVAHRRLAAFTRHGYDVFELEKVPGRSNIQIHIANFPRELQGCIALGASIGRVGEELGVTSSKATYHQFMDRLAGHGTIWLTVVDPLPAAA